VIRINRKLPAPAVLANGTALIAAMDAALLADPVDAGSAKAPFEFTNGIYGDKTVKDALKEMQHGKCAYCEGDFLAFCYGDVEHYRPKGFSQQAKGSRKTYPGYYWLAYDWSNLVLSCELCNRARKRNLFPLRNPGVRAKAPQHLAHEEPLLLDPAGAIDPREHIRFNANVPEACSDSDMGAASIDLYGLDRLKLNGLRLERLGHAKALAIIADHGARAGARAELQAEGALADAKLKEFVDPKAPFSAMVLDFLDRRAKAALLRAHAQPV